MKQGYDKLNASRAKKKKTNTDVQFSIKTSLIVNTQNVKHMISTYHTD